MPLLAQVLPGLRELRTPLSAGYAWIIVAYLLVADSLPTHVDELPPPLARIFPLIHDFGWVAVGVATSVVAYVLGILSIALTHSLPSAISHSDFMRELSTDDYYPVRWPGAQDAIEYLLNERFVIDDEFRQNLVEKLDVEALTSVLSEKFNRNRGPVLILAKKRWRVPEDLASIREASAQERQEIAETLIGGAASNASLRANLIEAVINLPSISDRATIELDALPEQLLVAAPAVHERWDRLNAEAEFRLGLAPPLLLLPLVVDSLGQHNFLILALALLPTALLVWSGREKSADARNQLIGAWRAEVVPSPALKSAREGKILWLETLT
jgi:hypothetical protein